MRRLERTAPLIDRRHGRGGPVRYRRIETVSVAAALCMLATPALSHHSEAAFDMQAVVAFEGAVTDVSWRNPHVYLKVRAASDAGQPIEWDIETGATPLLARSGWTPDSLKPGERITVRAHPARDRERRYALLIALEKEDGTVLRQSVTNSVATGAAASIAGIWKGNLAHLADLSQGFDALPLTPAGTAARAAFDVNVENPAARCVGYPTPATILASGLFLNQIELGEAIVTLRSEWFDVERTVFMDGRGHPDGDERTLLGHSIGWWEDGTLVVDTVNFADHRSPYQTGVPSGPRKHVTERYTLSADGRNLEVGFTLEDPDYLDGSFSGSVEWIYRPDLEFFEFDCDPLVSGQYVPR